MEESLLLYFLKKYGKWGVVFIIGGVIAAKALFNWASTELENSNEVVELVIQNDVEVYIDISPNDDP